MPDEPADEPEIEFPDDMPEALREQVRAQVRAQHQANMQAQLARNADAHQLLGFLESLTVDDSKALRAILRFAQTDPHVASYYEGVLSVMLAQKEKKCWACGTNHDDALKDIMGGEPKPEPEPPTVAEALVDQPDGSLAVESFDRGVLAAQAESLNVKFIGPVGPNCPVECLGCGFKSVSFADRALRNDCIRCIDKAKWG